MCVTGSRDAGVLQGHRDEVDMTGFIIPKAPADKRRTIETIED